MAGYHTENCQTPSPASTPHAMQITPPESIGGHGVNGAAVNIPGAGTPDQAPTSPKVRRNEIERGEGNDAATSQAKSAAMQNAPNPGAQ